MRIKSVTWFVGLFVLLSVVIILTTDFMTLKEKGAEPVLDGQGMWEETDSEDNVIVVFEVRFQDDDGDPDYVDLFVNEVEYEMEQEREISTLQLHVFRESK